MTLGQVLEPADRQDEHIEALRQIIARKPTCLSQTTRRSEWKYMLPFDLDLASSGFVDAHGQRPDITSFLPPSQRRVRRNLFQDICVESDRSQSPCRAKVPEGHAGLQSIGHSNT